MLVGDYKIRIFNLDSKNEMKQALTRFKNGYYELSEPEYHCKYYILSYQLYSDKEWFGIGIYSDDSSFQPTIVSHYSDNALLLIYNKHVTLLSLCDGKICFDYTSDSTVYFSKYFYDTIVAVSELSVVQLKLNGDILVVHTLDDVLESFNFEQEDLVCQTMNGCTRYPLQTCEMQSN